MDREFHIRFTLSDVLKLVMASPVVVVLVYCLLALPWESNNAPAWVQAFGSIAAIIAAGLFPIWHFEVQERKRQQDLLKVMRVLCDEALESLWSLSNCFVMPEHEVAWMRDYLKQQKDKSWDVLLSSIAQLPISGLPPKKVVELGQMREAVAHGLLVSGMIQEWVDKGRSSADEVVRLRERRDKLGIIRDGLPPLENGVAQHKVDAQLKGESHEEEMPSYPVGKCKFYVRPFWYHVAPGHVPKAAQVQVFPPYGSGEPVVAKVEAPSQGWLDIYELYGAARKEAIKIIQSIEERDQGVY